MPEDKFFGMIASRAISHGYDNSYFNFSKAGWYVNTIHQNSYFICIKIIKDGVTYYMLCHEGTQTAGQFKTDLEAINNKKRKKVKGMKGQILKEIWNEFNKHKSTYENFVNEYKSKGTLLFSGHSLGGAVAGVAGAVFKIKSYLIAPIPFMVHKNWLKNYPSDKKPTSYVNKSDPCIGDSGQATQINWEISRHYSVNYVNNGYWTNSHFVSSFVNYFRSKTGNLC